jgi:hypothetical protein
MYPNFQGSFVLLLVIILWSITWKGYALWTAAKHNHKRWFVVILLLNTVGILEIFYIFKIIKRSSEDVKRDFRKALSIFRK